MTPTEFAPSYYTSTCVAVNCPANSSGDAVLGCTCNPGFSGSVGRLVGAPYYTSSCSFVTCPLYAVLKPKACGTTSCICSCNLGYMPTQNNVASTHLNFSVMFGKYTSVCSIVRCPVNSHGINIISNCTCNAGFIGVVLSTESYPYFASTCEPAQCPVNSYGLGGAAGCKCLPGYSGAVQATSVGPAFYSSTCSPSVCPSMSNGGGGTDGCVCNAGYNGSVLATTTGPLYYTSSCAAAPCPAYSRGVGGKFGCVCNEGNHTYLILVICKFFKLPALYYYLVFCYKLNLAETLFLMIILNLYILTVFFFLHLRV